MKKTDYFIGIDIASNDFTASIFTQSEGIIGIKENVSNNIAGFKDFIKWLAQKGITTENSVICMEATGVYSEQISYFLYTKGYQVVVEAPHKVKKAFHFEDKTDTVDSKQIAEYSYRFYDKLTLWRPNDEVFEQIKTLMSTREHLTEQLIADKNALKSLERKVVKTPLANKIYKKNIKNVQKSIDIIDDEIKKLIDKKPTIKQTIANLDTIVGVGNLLAVNIMFVTNGFTNTSYKNIASLIGIAPHQYSSGKSVHRTPKSRRHGNHTIRKLLHLAARSVATHNEKFKKYFLRKLEEGKPKKLIYNNIANKLLKIICAIIKSNTPYIKNYKSINPILLKNS